MGPLSNSPSAKFVPYTHPLSASERFFHRFIERSTIDPDEIYAQKHLLNFLFHIGFELEEDKYIADPEGRSWPALFRLGEPVVSDPELDYVSPCDCKPGKVTFEAYCTIIKNRFR
jgi:hypothetical protein